MQDYKFTTTGYIGYEQDVLRIRNANRDIPKTLEESAWRYQSLVGAPEPKVFWVHDAAGRAVGMASVIYRLYWVDSKPEYFGILGDISLTSELRGRGLGKELILFVNRYLDTSVPARLGFIIPNLAAEKTVASVGWKAEGRHILYVMPVSLWAKIRKMTGLPPAKAKHSFFADILKRFLSSYVPNGYSLQSIDKLDKEFDRFWELYPKSGLALEDRSAASLKWRYLDYPERNFTIMALRYQDEFAGYAVVKFSDDQRTCEIYDLLIAKPHRVECLIAALVIQCMQLAFIIEVRIILSDKHPYRAHLGRLGFLRRASLGAYQLYGSCGMTINRDLAWMITAGDKDM